MMHDYWMGDGHWGWMGVWWVFGTLFIGAVFWLLWRATRRTFEGGADSADDILKRRYAKGEIDKQTFDRMWSDLHGPHGGAA